MKRYRHYFTREEERANEKGHEDERYRNHNFDHNCNFPRNDIDEAYCQGKRDEREEIEERRAEERREEERQEEERHERRRHEQRQEEEAEHQQLMEEQQAIKEQNSQEEESQNER